MNSWQCEGYAPRLTGNAYAFLLPGNFSFDAACANEVSASKQRASLLISDKKSRFFLNEESGDFVTFLTAKSRNGLSRSFSQGGATKMHCLIGYTGFVGGNLYHQRPYDVLINSKNFQKLRDQTFDRIVCAGVSAVKWQANKDPEGDWQRISALIDVLKTVQAKKFILISTIDVYASVQNLDESFDCHSVPNHAYGTNRLKFEDFCREHFSDCLIVRLPGLFGNGLKKNVIYDLLHDNCLEMINPKSSFQYYFLDNLSGDIERCEKAGLKLVNLFTEPIATREILTRFFPEKSVGSKPSAEGHYDLGTRHANVFGKNGKYICSRQEVLAQLSTFIERERHA